MALPVELGDGREWEFAKIEGNEMGPGAREMRKRAEFEVPFERKRVVVGILSPLGVDATDGRG